MFNQTEVTQMSKENVIRLRIMRRDEDKEKTHGKQG